MSIVALWCFAWALIGFRNHDAVATYDQRPGYRETMQRCAGDRLQFRSNGEWLSRPATRLDMTICTDRVRAAYLAAETADHRRVTLATLLWALAPSLATLLLAAFAPELRRIVRKH